MKKSHLFTPNEAMLNTGSSCDCRWTNTMHRHTHRFGVCNFKVRISLAPALVWHTVWQSLKSLLHTFVVSRLQSKQTTTGGIKVCVTACASYLQHSAFCSLRIFMAVRYAENLTLFRSATGRDRDREMKGGWTKRKQRQKIRSATEICSLCRLLLLFIA